MTLQDRWSSQTARRLESRLQSIPTLIFAGICTLLLAVFTICIRKNDPLTLLSDPRELLNTLLNDAEAIAIMVAVLLYLKGAPDRRAQKHYEAWRVIDTAAAAKVNTSYARYRALSDLHQDGVPLRWLEAPKANLSGIVLAGADLEGANLAGSNLERANFRGANLRGANLTGANLSHANLIGCDLTNADLRAAILRSSLLWKATLWEANLANAELRWAEFDQSQLDHAKLDHTVLPDGSYSESLDEVYR